MAPNNLNRGAKAGKGSGKAPNGKGRKTGSGELEGPTAGNDIVKKGNKGKAAAAKVKKGKKQSTPSLKQKLRKESKVVKLDSLAWKAVEIPDNVNDFLGCYGLEEIDGVDVKIVDGKAQFIVKDDSKSKKNGAADNADDVADDVTDQAILDGESTDSIADSAEAGQLDSEEVASDDAVIDDDNMEEEEFAGFEDETVPETEVATIAEMSVEDVDENDDSNDDELRANIFSRLDMELPEKVHLPGWQEEGGKLKLNPFILNALSGLEFAKPTPIQKETIPLAMAGKDVIGKATTGSGKTLAYGIPILERYLDNLPQIKRNISQKIVNCPSGIIFTPTRELAHQVVDHLVKLAKFTPLLQYGIVTLTGGLSIQKQQRLLAHGPGIIVATPGRFLDLIEKDSEVCKRLSSTDILVLDEADRLLQDGHFDEFEKILEIMGKSRPKKENMLWKWQTLVFSATFARDLFGKLDKSLRKGFSGQGSSLIDDDEILQLLNSKLKFRDSKPSLIDANPKEIISGQITEALVECGPTERDLYLYYFLLMYPGSTLVFSNSIDSVKRLVPLLNNLNIPAFAIHSGMMQKQRLRALERFREASKKNQSTVLLASDVAARGLDIPQIDHVAHYHLPRSADIYIHRLGRTARAGAEGVLIMFCSPQEALGPLRKLRKLVANTSLAKGKLNMHSDVKLLPVEMDLVTQLKPRIAFASQLADALVSSTSTRKEDTWVKQAAEELGIENLSDVEEFEDDMIKKQRKRKEGKLMTKEQQKVVRFQLRELLSKPIRKNARRSYLTSGLENLAHQMVLGNTHKEVLGHQVVNALDDLRKKKTASKVLKSKKQSKKGPANNTENKVSKK